MQAEFLEDFSKNGSAVFNKVKRKYITLPILTKSYWKAVGSQCFRAGTLFNRVGHGIRDVCCPNECPYAFDHTIKLCKCKSSSNLFTVFAKTCQCPILTSSGELGS